MDENGYLRKSVKSQLGTELLKLCPPIDKKGPETPPQIHAIIIDFIALILTLEKSQTSSSCQDIP